MKRAVALALVVACGGKGEDTPTKPRTGSTTDSTPPVIDTGTPPDPGLEVQTSATDPVTCAEPSLRLARPFDRTYAPAEAPKDSWFWGGGVVVADFDGDGRKDIVLPGYHGTRLFLRQPDGTYAIDGQLDAMGLGFASGGSAADYDGDGDFDLLITRYLGSNVLLRNDGGTFVDVTAAAGLSPAVRRSMASTWADYDGDGDLDLFIGAYGFIDESGTDHSEFLPADPSFLYRNEGDGTFADVSADLPQDVHDGYTFVASWLDLDGDGLPELYVVNDFGVATPNQLLWNRGGGVLEPDDGSHGLMLEITGMGLGIGDLNGDGQYDFVMPEWNGVVTMESTELGSWVQTSFARGITNDVFRAQKVGWGADIVDLDNDGDADVPVVYGYLLTELYDAPRYEPDAVYDQAEDGSFKDLGVAWTFADTGDARGFVITDLDGNGWVDVVKRDLQGPTALLQARCGAGHWVGVELRQPGPNRYAVGAKVRVWAGGQRMAEPILAGGLSHASGGPPEAHFGLGEADIIQRIEVTWPDGERSNVWDLGADRVWTITRP